MNAFVRLGLALTVAGGVLVGLAGPASAHAVCARDSHAHRHGDHVDQWKWVLDEQASVTHHWSIYRNSHTGAYDRVACRN